MSSKRLFLQSLVGLGLMPLAGAIRPAAAASSHAAALPNPVLLTQHNKPVRFYDDCIKDRIVILNMMYTSCAGICPPNTANLKAVRDALGDRVGRDIFIYSLTLQPERDRPRDLLEYANRYKTGDGWTFLTGKRADMELVRRRMGFFDSDPVADRDPARHSGVLRIGHDRLDRWFMMPALSTVESIVYEVRNLPA